MNIFFGIVAFFAVVVAVMYLNHNRNVDA